MISMAITKIVTTADLGIGPIVVLEEREGERWFPIFIGHYEAAAIDREILGIEPPRPLPHDLMYNIVQELGGKLEQVMISELRENTFFALLRIRAENGELRDVDCRPSDAMAMAIRAKAPIYVEPDVLARASE